MEKGDKVIAKGFENRIGKIYKIHDNDFYHVYFERMGIFGFPKEDLTIIEETSK